MLCCLVVFFQAEDGIRDLVRSRGLGDVYKRQEQSKLADNYAHVEDLDIEEDLEEAEDATSNDMKPVSYTHLTLPTSDLV